jgi:hypothetical protein
MPLKQRGCLFEIGQHPRGVGGVFFRLTCEGLGLRRLQRQAPVQVDAAESSRLFKKTQSVIYEYLRDRIGVMLFPG